LLIQENLASNHTPEDPRKNVIQISHNLLPYLAGTFPHRTELRTIRLRYHNETEVHQILRRCSTQGEEQSQIECLEDVRDIWCERMVQLVHE
jgi:hypothetical protein